MTPTPTVGEARPVQKRLYTRLPALALLFYLLCLSPTAQGNDGLVTVLQPMNSRQIERTFQTQTRVVSRSGSDADAFLTQLRETEPLAQHMASLEAFGSIYRQAAGFPNAIKAMRLNQKYSTTPSWAELQNMSDVTSVVYKREFDRKAQPSALESLIESELGIDATVHAYFTPANAQTLEPHTDPYDVVVVQVANQKHWTLCLPQTDNATVSLSEADRAQLQEIKRSHLDGCTTYTMSMLQPMICRNVTLHQGDSMYLPKGVIHYAVTTDTPSAHLTIGLSRTGRTWLDVLTAQCQRTTLPSYVCHQYEALANAVGQTPEGLIWHELAVPGLATWREQLCASLSPLIMGEASYSLLSALSGIRFEQLQRSLGDRSGLYWPRQKLRQNLGALLQCAGNELVERVSSVRDTAMGMERSRRGTSWVAPCSSAGTCSSSGCDCDGSNCGGSVNCDSSCDSGCDQNCGCDGGTSCNAGYYQSGDTVDGVCVACTAGKAQSSSGQTSCSSCAQGKYASGTGNTACTSCSSGTYTDQTGQSSCKQAGTGYYVSDSDRTTRKACPVGKYSDVNTANSCKSCQSSPWPGKYQDSTAQSSCQTCPDGTYVTTTGATECIDQPAFSVTYEAYAKNITIKIDNSAQRWAKFRVTLGLWRDREYAYDDAVGYPLEVSADTSGSGYADISDHTFANLVPGQYYYLKVESQDKDASEYEDEAAEFNIVQTTCGCDQSDTTGPPIDVSATQHMGKIFFQWTDESYCEDGFIMRRDTNTFTSSYDVASSSACGTTHHPETIYDDAVISPEVDVGSAYSYCISAYSRTTVVWADNQQLDSRYESSQTCIDFKIKWEAMVKGSVNIGNDEFESVPVADTTIEWTLGGVLSGTTTTDSNGQYEIYIQTDLLSQKYEQMNISVSKQSEAVNHTYECDGLPCTSRTFLVEWLTFNTEADFTDVSAVPVYGYVYINGTESDSNPDGCGMNNAHVCFNSHYSHSAIVCAYTDATGYYVAPIPAGMVVYGTVDRTPDGTVDTLSLVGDVLAYSYFSISFDELSSESINFHDVTTRNVTLQVAGGKCNRTLGTSTLVFSLPTCTIQKEVPVRYETTLQMPATLWEVTYTGTLPDDDTDIGDMMINYFEAAGTLTQDADLSSDDTTVRWEYHSAATISVDIGSTLASSCDVHTINRDVISNVTVYVYEEYWNDQDDCTWVEGSLSVTNLLGESTAVADNLLAQSSITDAEYSRLVVCNTGCELELLYDDGDTSDTYTNARGELEIQTGEPELSSGEKEGVKYAKIFSASFTQSVYQPSTTYIPVVVLGSKIISDRFTMDFPEYFPLTIVYDPPGGESYAYYESAEASMTITHSEYKAFAGAYSEVAGGLSFGTSMETCVLMACVQWADYKTHVGVQTHIDTLESDLKGDRNADGSAVFTTTFSLKTSDYKGTPSDHLIITPSLVVRFADVRTISFNYTTCEASSSQDVQWSLNPRSATGAFSIKTYRFLQLEEIPTLQNNLALAQASYDALIAEGSTNDALINETLAKVEKLTEAIDGWTDIVDYIDNITAQAAAGNLTAQTNLMPTNLMQQARDFDMSLSSNAQASLEKNNAISFSGGGAKYSYETADEEESSKTTGHEFQLDWSTFVHADHDFEGATGGYIEGDLGAQGQNFRLNHTTRGTQTAERQGFELSDGDMGNEFLVEVYRDPYFNTLVFHTSAGSSSCLHESNTYALEQPRVQISREPTSAVLPSSKAFFTVYLMNDAISSATYELYVRNETGVSVAADGHPLFEPLLFEQMPGLGQYEQVIAIERYDMSRYTFDVVLGFRSRCESIEFLGRDDSAYELMQFSEVTLSVEFLQPCSQVDWTGTMSRESSFLVSIEENAEVFRITLTNPETSSRRWEDNARLEGVHLMYRRVGDVDWTYARNASGDILNFMYDESDYGYSSLNWAVDGVLDGEYELQTAAECTAAGLDPPDGINEVFSSIISGRIDREAPEIFSQPEPVDGVFSAGDVISVKMTEDILCSRPFLFYLSVDIDGLLQLGTNDVDIKCSGDTLSLSLYRHFSAATLAGTSVTVTITNLLDLAQNAADEISWTYEYEATTEDSTTVSVTVSQLVLTVAWNDTYADLSSVASIALAAEVASELATSLGISSARIAVTRFSDENNMTAADLVFLPPSTTTARRRRSEDLSSEALVFLLEQALQNGGNFSIVSADGNTYLETSSVIDTDTSTTEATTVTTTTTTTTFAAASALSQTWDSDVSAVFGLVVAVLAVQVLGFVGLYLYLKKRLGSKHSDAAALGRKKGHFALASQRQPVSTSRIESRPRLQESQMSGEGTYNLATSAKTTVQLIDNDNDYDFARNPSLSGRRLSVVEA
ncbi:uncharacterized protein MONBRDRAFT_33191 [Monosiga brevicollis MX1]|uniref:Ribosomal oxygenase 2 n=1 Tax=Monosiga brevicollis TaxID=81824 RepID=A9V427_MONBE|nr:uncharacterized protein MONBRDRAFT_33191 [Monosiga brevicollis MX1]EDQ87631.1 predicted protein [Monosiga brevicollis MX1]|eukprot:XP_001747551.1 hypothetical protein [Monosiga brevicollis MX1]